MFPKCQGKKWHPFKENNHHGPHPPSTESTSTIHFLYISSYPIRRPQTTTPQKKQQLIYTNLPTSTFFWEATSETSHFYLPTASVKNMIPAPLARRPVFFGWSARKLAEVLTTGAWQCSNEHRGFRCFKMLLEAEIFTLNGCFNWMPNIHFEKGMFQVPGV